LPLPALLAPVVRAAGKVLARRFVTAYRRANPAVSLAELDWFRALHCARVLVNDTELRAAHGPDGGGHPLHLVAPAAANHLAAATGVAIGP
jgi:hypothetical protein